MSEETAVNSESPPPPSAGQVKKELFSEKKEEFIDDLECLYIKGNQSGRLMYAKKWPDIAERLFPKELTRIDHEGLQNEEEREKREKLEEEAELKHDEMLSIFSGMEKNLVVYGSLQLPALEAIMNKIDRTLAEYIFAERFVNKYFAGGAPPPSTSETDSETETPSDSQEAPAEAPSEVAAISTAEQAPTTPVTPEQVEEPTIESDIVAESIGHVDHSYNTKIPDYDAKPTVDTNGDGVIDEKDSAASWLDEPEDEFDDVMPISTEASPQQEGDRPPPTMGLNAHKEAEGSQVSSQEQAPAEPSPDPNQAETAENTTPPPANSAPAVPPEETTMGTPTPPSSADAAMPSSDSPSEGGRKPPLPEQETGLRKPTLPGQEEPQSSAPPPSAPPSPVADDQNKPVFGDMPPPPSSTPPSAPPAAPESGAPENKPVFGDMPPPPQSGQAAPPTSPRPAEQGSATDAPRVPPLPGQSSHSPPQGGTQPDEKAPRKPSLDDLPPLPGSDDGSDY